MNHGGIYNSYSGFIIIIHTGIYNHTTLQVEFGHTLYWHKMQIKPTLSFGANKVCDHYSILRGHIKMTRKRCCIIIKNSAVINTKYELCKYNHACHDL